MEDITILEKTVVKYNKSRKGRKSVIIDSNAYDCNDDEFLGWVILRMGGLSSSNRLIFRKMVLKELDKINEE